MKVKLLSHVRLIATPWTAAYQAPPSMEFSRREYWPGVPLVMQRPDSFEKKDVGSHFINAYCSFAFFGLRSANFPLKQMDKKIKKKKQMDIFLVILMRL